MKVLLGVSGGIAAYKACDIARRLMEMNLSVQVVMTANAEKFITPLTFEALTGQPVVRANMPAPGEEPMPHITYTQEASLFVVAPATANIIGKFAGGVADDTLCTMLIAGNAPLLFAPAMNTKMYENEVVQENISKLKSRGVSFIGPGAGRLACGDEGDGKLADVNDIVCKVEELLALGRDYAGKRIVVTAGGTREPVDAVRYIGNRSSGKMGVAIAEEAHDRGASVTLIVGAMETPLPEGVEVIEALTAEEMLRAVAANFDDCSALIMTAAVGDYRVSSPASGKVKKKEKWSIELAPNPDIIGAMGKRKSRQAVVGFAAETDNPEENGKLKLIEKNMDMVVINNVARQDIGFGSDYNQVTIIRRSGETKNLVKAKKRVVARMILDDLASTLDEKANEPDHAVG